MKYLIAFVITAVALLFAYGVAFGEEMSDVFQRVSPAVVTIHAKQMNVLDLSATMTELDTAVNEIILKKHKEKDVLFPYSPKKGAGMIGSGFIISTDGLIITNNHVIEGSGNKNITIVLEDGSERDVDVIGTDKVTDIAVLKIAKNETDREFPIVAFGDSEKMKVGQQVFAVGSPFGINQAIFSPTHTSAGIGFAIPSKYAKLVVAEIVKTGEFKPKHIGLVIIENTEMLALVAGDTFYKGIRLQGIVGENDKILDHSDKLKSGDIIIMIDGVSVSTPAALIKEVAMHQIGDKVNLKVIRDGKLTVVRDLVIH